MVSPGNTTRREVSGESSPEILSRTKNGGYKPAGSKRPLLPTSGIKQANDLSAGLSRDLSDDRLSSTERMLDRESSSGDLFLSVVLT